MTISNFLIILIFFFLILFGNKIKIFSAFRQSMLKSMIPALVIGLIAFAGYAIGTLRLSGVVSGFFIGVLVFCYSTLGLAFAKSIPDFEPLPITKSYVSREGRLRQTALCILFSLLIVALLLAVNSILFKIFLVLFHEPDFSAKAVSSLPSNNKILAFPLLLAGAGIAEESMFRLFFQSIFQRLFKKAWPAILLSSLCFALYHLSPADSMYQIYWHYPLAQASTVFLTGIVLGWFYRKRGFETVVLGHTLLDYVGVLFTFH